MTGPSDQARAAIAKASAGTTVETEEHILAALYPVIRADVIAEVVGVLRAEGGKGEHTTWTFGLAAHFIEREFGAAS